MNRSVWTAVLISGCGLGWMGVDARAQGGEAARLPEVVVKADRLSEIRKQLWKTPGSVELVSSGEMEDQRSSNLKDALGMVPGVFVQPRQGAADESSLSIRGSGIRNNFHLRGVRLYLDGMLLSNADGFSDFDTIELLAMDHIEIYKGANGLEFGANSLGGGIHFISKKGYDSEPFRVRSEMGSFGFVKGQLSSGQKMSPALDYYVSVTGQREDGYRQHQELERERFYGNFGWIVSEDTDARFYLVAVNSRNELAGNLTKSQLQLAPRSAAAANLSLNQRRDTEILRPAASMTHRIDAHQRLETSVYYQWKDLDHPLGFAWVDNEFNDAGTQIRYVNDGSIGDQDNEFIVGIAPQYGRVLDANFQNNRGSRGLMTKNQVGETLNVGGWIQDVYSFLPDWKVVAGTRLDWSSRHLRDRFVSDGDQSSEVYYTGFSPRLGLIYEIGPEMQAYGNFSMAYEPPVFSELLLSNTSGLVNLQAQKSYQWELGTRGKWERLDWDLSIYNAEVEDELFSNHVGNTGLSLLSNISRTRHTGIEWGCGFDLWRGALVQNSLPDKEDRIRLETVYTWSDFRIVSDGPYTGKRLPGLPENYCVTQVVYRHPSGFHSSFRVETAPDAYFVDKANTLQNDGYTIFGMQAGMDFSNGLKLFAEIRNLTDVTYASAVSTTEVALPDSAQFKPADGFALYGGVQWSY